MSNNLDGAHGMQDLKMIQNLPTTSDMSAAGEDELAAEADEPPDELRPFSKLHSFADHPMAATSQFSKSALPKYNRKTSLLTKALHLESDEVEDSSNTVTHSSTPLSRGFSTASAGSNASLASTADLTSDGGITSPARTTTPSPPPPSSPDYSRFNVLHTSKLGSNIPTNIIAARELDASQLSPRTVAVPVLPVVVVDAPPRKRCIKFACGRNPSPKPNSQVKPTNIKVAEASPTEVKEAPAKRPSALRFMCPSRVAETQEKTEHTKASKQFNLSPLSRRARPRARRGSNSTARDSPRSISGSPVALRRRAPTSSPAPQVEFNPQDEKYRFHEFASSFEEEHGWAKEQLSHKQKITVNDTLKIENRIRQISEEAEREARDEEEDEDDNELNNDLDEDEDEDLSDGGNETDDEEGFAASDDESDGGSDYQFWTPGKTTASTSADHFDFIRPNPHRTASASSIDSISEAIPGLPAQPTSPLRLRKSNRRPKMRPGTPELPDSTDFVPGTLDEDRPLEQAYLNCLKQRKQNKHNIIPQDIDPSFPTSDPEDIDEDEADGSDDQLWLKGQLDDYSDDILNGRAGQGGARRHSSINQSPRRFHSPPPQRRGTARSPPPAGRRGTARSPPPAGRRGTARSPPPRRLFNQSPRQSPSNHLPRVLKSPPCTRRPSVEGEAVVPAQPQGIHFIPLGHRPDLTHTKSLPRGHHGFHNHHRAALRAEEEADDAASDATAQRRTAIDIVKGLEHKRQRRREKLLAKHCQKAAKEKEPRKPPVPGRGAERMREVGLEMAGRTRAHNQASAQYVLSI